MNPLIVDIKKNVQSMFIDT